MFLIPHRMVRWPWSDGTCTDRTPHASSPQCARAATCSSPAAQTSTSSATKYQRELLYYVKAAVCRACRIYDLEKNLELGSLLQHDGTITSLGLYNKQHMLSASEDGMI